MGHVTVSAARFRSMLANRHRTSQEAASAVTTRVDLTALARVDADVSFEDLERIAKYFKKSWAYLLCDAEEALPDLGQDHRTFANRSVPLGPEILSELESAAFMLEAASDLFPETVYWVPPILGLATVPARTMAEEVRDFLAVSAASQLAAKDEYAALRLWVDALQERGVYVSQRRIRSETIRAFSKVRGHQAVIVADTGDTPYARIFSLLHEYSHIVLRSTGICDLDQHSTVERYCNDVAAIALLPEDLMRQEVHAGMFRGDEVGDDELLRSLSHRLRVSQAALLIRLRDAEVITSDGYAAMEARRRTRRVVRKGGGGQYYAVAINRVGRRFAREVFGAVADGTINRTDAGALLGVRTHLVERYRDHLVGVDQVVK